MPAQLRIARGLGSLTLSWSPSPWARSCGLLADSDRLHFVRSVSGCVTVADCSRARIAYTREAPRRQSPQLRIARRLGSLTLHTLAGSPALGCGLLAGSDRLHCTASPPRAPSRCGLLAGSDRLHSSQGRSRPG